MPQPKLTPSELLREVIMHLTDLPQEIIVEFNETPHTATFDIEVDDSDVGKVLGKGGAHANALRVLFGAIYGKHGKRLMLQVVDPNRR